MPLRRTCLALAVALAATAAAGDPAPRAVLCDEPFADGPTGVSFSADGRTLFAAHPDRACLWDPATGKVTATLRDSAVGTGRPFGSAVLGPDGKAVATLQGDDLTLWDVAAGARRRLPPGPAPTGPDDIQLTCSLAYHPAGTLLAGGDARGPVRLWDADGRLAGVLREHTGAVRAVAFAPDGSSLATAGADRQVRVWDMKARKCVACWDLPAGWKPWPGALAVSPDGARVAAGGSDPTVRVWDVATGKLTALVQGGEWVTAVAFSPDGKLLAAGEGTLKAAGGGKEPPGGEATPIRVWDLGTGRCLAALRRDRARWIVRLAFSPDGKTLAAAATHHSPTTGAVELWAVPGRD